MRLGPATYSANYQLVEPRQDKGVPKFWEPAPAKAKEPTEQLLDISPNYDFDKPNKLTFAYCEPLSGLSPAHTPEKEKHPERWRFYDFDLDVVREELAKDISFARNLSLDEFRGKEEFFNMLVEHNRRQEKRPPVGLYSPRDPFDKPIEVDFSKARGRDVGDLVRLIERLVLCRGWTRTGRGMCWC